MFSSIYPRSVLDTFTVIDCSPATQFKGYPDQGRLRNLAIEESLWTLFLYFTVNDFSLFVLEFISFWTMRTLRNRPHGTIIVTALYQFFPASLVLIVSFSIFLLIEIILYILISDRINTVNTANTILISYTICEYSSVVDSSWFSCETVTTVTKWKAKTK